MICSNILRSWATSIELLKPSNLMPFMKQSFSRFCHSSKNFLSHFWWLLIIDALLALSLLQKNLLFAKTNHYMNISYFVLIIFFTLLIRQDPFQQTSNKDYLKNFWHCLLWYFTFFCLGMFFFYLLIVMLVPVQILLHKINLGLNNTPVNPLQTMIFASTMIQSLAMLASIIFVFSSNFMLFYWLDSNRSCRSFWKTSKNGLHLLFHHIPIFTITLFVLITLLKGTSFTLEQLGVNTEHGLFQHISLSYENASTGIIFVGYMLVRYLNVLFGFFTVSVLYTFYQKEKTIPFSAE